MVRRKVEKGKRYVKNEYAMKEGFSFGLIGWLEKEKPIADTIVLGGEQSVFRVERKEIDKDGHFSKSHPVICDLLQERTGLTDQIRKIKDLRKMVSLSPLVVDNCISLSDQVEHGIISGVENVRMLNSVTLPVKGGTESRDQYIRDGRKLIKTDAYRVIPAGSVLYLTGKPSFSCSLPMPEKIGYNAVVLDVPKQTPKGGNDYVQA